MNHTTQRNYSDPRHLTYSHTFEYSEMHFNHKLWNYFHYKQIENRLLSWAKAAKGDYFRQPRDWHLVEGNLVVQLPPLPEGYLPFSQLTNAQISDEAKGKVLISLCKALSILHEEQFYMGFLLPDMLFFHPQTLTIKLDVQPFPSGIEFINHLLTDYPFTSFPRYARRFLLSRVADFESINLLIQSIYSSVPTALRQLSERLRTGPETLLFADEIADSIRLGLHLPEDPPHISYVSSNWLHPAAAPITHDQREHFRVFLQSKEKRLLGLICEDEAIRFDLYTQYVNEVMEKGYFFKIVTQELPYSTLREVVSRTLHIAYGILPESVTMLRNLSRKFDQLLKKHYEGDDILYLLTEWLYQFFSSIIPMFPVQNFFFTFENCENFDEDSQLILENFWREHGHEMKGLHLIFSGSQLPTQFTGISFQTLEIHHSDQAIYEQLLSSQFGRADSTLLYELRNWFYEHKINVSHCRIILEELIQSGCIHLTNQGWRKTAKFHLDNERLHSLRLFAKRIALLDNEELELLRLLCCLPMPISVFSLFTANQMDLGMILPSVTKLAEIGVVHVSHNDSLFISNEIAQLVLQQLPSVQLTSYYQRALRYQHQFRPLALPQLITLSSQASEYKVEYYLLLKYYKQIRSLLSYGQKVELLERIKYLYKKLERPYLIS